MFLERWRHVLRLRLRSLLRRDRLVEELNQELQAHLDDARGFRWRVVSGCSRLARHPIAAMRCQ